MEKRIVQKQTIDNQEIIEYSIKTPELEVRFINLGGVITKIAMAQDGFAENLVLNYDNYADYIVNEGYINAIVGRTSNRITKGEFELEGKKIQLDQNAGGHNLHGGVQNLTHSFFTVEEVEKGYAMSAMLPAQDKGFPGNLNVTVRYEIVAAELKITYEATTDATTIVNLTQHAYFNLSGSASRSIYEHELMIAAPNVAIIDETSAFSQELLPVSGTRFDFTNERLVDPSPYDEHYLFDNTNGYDHLMVLSPDVDTIVKLKDPVSGRVMTMSSTEPSMQFYAGNFLSDSQVFENGLLGRPHMAACFETHRIPFDFASQTIHPGEVYKQVTSFKFSLEG